jgi:hypothetical protein
MAVPKKKNKKVKYKYSVIKKQYLNIIKDGIQICNFCKKKKKEKNTLNTISKKKIFLNFKYKFLKKKKKKKKKKNYEK